MQFDLDAIVFYYWFLAAKFAFANLSDGQLADELPFGKQSASELNYQIH